MQATRCGTRDLFAIFTVRIAEVLVKRHAWPQLAEELIKLQTHLDTGKFERHIHARLLAGVFIAPCVTAFHLTQHLQSLF